MTNLLVFKTKLEEISDDDEDTLNENREERKLFEDFYFILLAQTKSLIQEVALSRLEDNNVSNHSVRTNISVHHNPSKNVRLPKISLPTFSGDSNCWSSFYDKFKSLIHDDNTLATSKKYFYLQSALSGQAAKLIEDLERTNRNYEVVAWNLLKERYEDSKALIKNNLQLILDTTTLVKEIIELKKLLSYVEKNIRALQNLGEPVDKWDTLLLFLLTDKLDKITKTEWETKTSKIKSPTIEMFTESSSKYLKFVYFAMLITLFIIVQNFYNYKCQIGFKA